MKKTTKITSQYVSPTAVELPDPMPVAYITIDINAFRPLGGVTPISAQFSLGALIGNPDSDPSVSIGPSGKSIIVAGLVSPINLVYQLWSDNWIILGVTFTRRKWFANETDPQPREDSLGQLQFPSFSVETLPLYDGSPQRYYRQLTVLDMNYNEYSGISYDYLILVQDIDSGQIGIIDPVIEHESVEALPARKK